MGRTLPSTMDLMRMEKSELRRFNRALRKEDQLVFDELWTYVSKHLMACNKSDHVLPLEIFFFAMLLEEHKEVMRLRREVEELKVFKRLETSPAPVFPP